MPKCEIFQDIKGGWRWRRVDKNDNIEYHSEQSFETREECEKHGKDNGCTSYKFGHRFIQEED
jgi:uncharacterized protein YegP (UPF0339 family)